MNKDSGDDLRMFRPSDRAVDRSSFLPVCAMEIRRWVVEEDSHDESAWTRLLRAWVRAELAPRLPG